MQRSFDDLGTPLRDVTFCVLDIETTGGDRGTDLITELGAIRVCGGESLGTFQTLVNPGRAIPPTITVLTGITESMVARAPRIEEVLPSLLEFIGIDDVVVGHNVSFDLAFINAALLRGGYPALSHRVVDTLPLARRLVRDEVPDCRLGTLASRLRLDHRPNHRALDDALATADLLHVMLERAASLGVLGLDDLLLLPGIAGHPQVAKLKLTDHLPRCSGVYLFHGANDEVIYVGKATNLRQRVRTYFSSDDRRKIGPMLRETRRLSYIVTPDPITAEVLETRQIQQFSPSYNKVGRTWTKYCYIRLSTHEAWPRLSIVAEPTAKGVVIGPISSRAQATAVIEALHTVIPLRRCSVKLGRAYQPPVGAASCSPAQLGVAMCPCAGDADPARYADAVSRAVLALTGSPAIVLGALADRMSTLATAQRYEEAALVRDRARAFATAMHRQRLGDQLRSAGRAAVRIGQVTLHLEYGVLSATSIDGQLPIPLQLAGPTMPPSTVPLPKQAADEVLCLARALERNAHRLRLLWCDGVWAWPTSPVGEITRLAA